jgi:hypothetical protein
LRKRSSFSSTANRFVKTSLATSLNRANSSKGSTIINRSKALTLASNHIPIAQNGCQGSIVLREGDANFQRFPILRKEEVQIYRNTQDSTLPISYGEVTQRI